MSESYTQGNLYLPSSPCELTIAARIEQGKLVSFTIYLSYNGGQCYILLTACGQPH
jgi:hypothetical protein